ncbi:MAG: hypothetical protein WCN98_14305, partial [Verrucomicrobiaceae bacterium]
ALGVEARKAGLNAGWELRLPADAVGVSEATARRDVAGASSDAPESPDGKVLGDDENYSPAEVAGLERARREQAERAPIVAPLRKCRCGPRTIPSANSDGEVACHKCGHPIAGGQS